MPKKCFVVRIEVEALVIAEDETEARDFGMDALREELSNVSEDDIDVDIAKHFPGGWSGNCLVYGADRDTYARDALKLNPEYLEEVKKLKEARDHFAKRSAEQKAQKEGSKD